MVDKLAKVSALTNDATAKSLYIAKRDAFRNNPNAMKELAKWKGHDDDFDYPILTCGLIPKSLRPFEVGGVFYSKSDTFFSNYKAHNKNSVLSESANSYIILNKESYDRRQYPEWFDAKYKPGVNTPEGQAFAHMLVIPKRRVLNVVDPEATANSGAMLKEMKDHFRQFWKHDHGAQRSLKGLEEILVNRNIEIAEKGATAELSKELTLDVMTTFDKMSAAYRKLDAEDFVYAFHPFPDCSVGHLHMHVFPKDDGFRAFSTLRHDWKTIPLDIILEVESKGGNRLL